MGRIIVLAVGFVIAGLLSGGFYTVAGSVTAGSVIVNRFTGSAWNCTVVGCKPIKFE